MLYQLKNGRTINISLDKFLDMTDDELQNLECASGGMEVENPFSDSVITRFDNDNDEEELEFIEDQEFDLTELTSEEKLSDLDIPDE